jgi:hypothetical protein
LEEADSVVSYLAEFPDTALTQSPPGHDVPIKAKRRGLTQLGGIFGRRKQPTQPAQPADALSPYRSRAAELALEGLAKATHNKAACAQFLALLAVKLAELVTDLKSVGADAAEVQPLEKLLTDLQHFLGGPRANEELARLWNEAEAVLQAFSLAMPATPATKRRESFWK